MSVTVLDEAVREHKPAHIFALFSGGHDSLTSTAIAATHPSFAAAVVLTSSGVPVGDTTLLAALREARADEIEMDGARRAYAAGLGATEWRAFLNEDEWRELCDLRPGLAPFVGEATQ